jgi:hypothetical protein
VYLHRSWYGVGLQPSRSGARAVPRRGLPTVRRSQAHSALAAYNCLFISFSIVTWYIFADNDGSGADTPVLHAIAGRRGTCMHHWEHLCETLLIFVLDLACAPQFIFACSFVGLRNGQPARFSLAYSRDYPGRLGDVVMFQVTGGNFATSYPLIVWFPPGQCVFRVTAHAFRLCPDCPLHSCCVLPCKAILRARASMRGFYCTYIRWLTCCLHALDRARRSFSCARAPFEVSFQRGPTAPPEYGAHSHQRKEGL